MDHYKEQLDILKEFANEKTTGDRVAEQIDQLVNDIEEDNFVVTVLGEFKKGKSTLINALLRQDILPTDVLPATAFIHKISHGASRALKAVSDVGSDEYQLHSSALKSFTYNENEAQSLKYLSFEMDLSHLDKKLTLIDTPGVGDLQDHKFEVTYDSIPRSNVVIFTLDLTTPIRKTELEYLKDSILPMLTGDIIFVGNFSDRLDDDELDEVVNYMETKLKKELEMNIALWPVSSSIALKGHDDEEWRAFEEDLIAKIKSGAQIVKKQQVIEQRVELIKSALEDEIKRVLSMKKMDEEHLEQVLSNLLTLKNHLNETVKQFSHKAEKLKQNLQSIYQNKIHEYVDDLEEDIDNEIIMNLPGDLKNYFEKMLPKKIEKRIVKWIKQSETELRQNVVKIEEQMTEFMKLEIEDTLSSGNELLTGNKVSRDLVSFSVSPSKKKADARIESGVAVSAAGGLAALTAGSLLLLPIMLVGAPFLNDYLKDKKLERVREQIRPLIKERFDELRKLLSENFDEYIYETVDETRDEIIENYRMQVEETEADIRHEINVRTDKLEEGYQINEGDWDACIAQIENLSAGKAAV
ncbi:dynamin family protein [Salipaludibacillus aurantiacus]|uniref:Dynamin family protein n=1 Tax=Salipaludibacillus aurantiacus TaxID=1601833 RepID=A0A1H9UF98_9BACI|nr:dynamin family protein [Salipaludibacillus aurantiacus]SES08042.1 Dynamin family protein [Salipaludibacillus aurantiacus]